MKKWPTPTKASGNVNVDTDNLNALFARDNLGQTQWMQRQSLDGRSLDELDWDQLYSRGSSVQATRHYVYNSARELCKLVEPESLATILAYDGAGNLAWSTSGSTYISLTSCNTGNIPAAERTIRLYDARNRITTLSFPDGRGDTEYTYTPDGLLNTIRSYNGSSPLTITTQSYTYNRRRLQASEYLSIRISDMIIPVPTVQSNYNANGHLSSQSWGGLTVNFSPNALGQPTRAGSYATNVSYHPNGAVKQFTYGNGIVHTLTQNTRGLPDRSSHSYGSTRYVDDGYDYDANGNVAAITDGATDQNGRGNRDMLYDGLDRLTRVTSPMWGNAYYDYDALDNLTRVRLTTGTGARHHHLCYSSTTNRLATVRTSSCSGSTVLSFSYDVQGNVKTKGGTTYDFDYGNRLRRASGGGVATTTYLYDGHGRRVRDSVSGTTSMHKYSQYTSDGRLVYASDHRRRVESLYIYLGNNLIAIRERNQTNGAFSTKYQHIDALGSPVAITNDSRQVIERSEYEPYGQVLNRPLRDNPGYTGHVEDQATGLNYMQQRYYDPQIGRFISTDPVAPSPETGANFNRYWYGNNNPYKYVDPDGREVIAFYSNVDRRLLMIDSDTRKFSFVEAESGGRPFGDPVPPGQYAILERAGRDGFYRLERRDSRFGDDKTPEGRSELRLHGPGRTIGCISVCTQEGFSGIDGLLKSTSTSAVDVESKSWIGRIFGRTETLRQYGNLQVLSDGSKLNFNQSTGEVSIRTLETGSRIPQHRAICTVDGDGLCK